MRQFFKNHWESWVGYHYLYPKDSYYYYARNRGYYYIISIKYFLGITILLDFIYTVCKIYRGSKSEFALSLMPFTFFYAAFLLVPLFEVTIFEFVSVGINAFVSLQSWILAMNYLKSYLKAS